MPYMASVIGTLLTTVKWTALTLIVVKVFLVSATFINYCVSSGYAAEPTSLSFKNSSWELSEFNVEYERFRDTYNFTNTHCDFFKNNNLDGDKTKIKQVPL